LGLLLVALPCAAAAVCRGGASNGIRESGEQCDGADNPYTCDQLCFVAGTIACKSDCTVNAAACEGCGNGRIEPALGELCDGTAVSCPPGTHGAPSCATSCQRVDGCWRCGDGTRNVDEECDVNDLGDAACDDPGETGGTPGCTASCQVDHGPCWRCGNGRIDPGEQCDDGGTAPGDGCGATCQRECGNGTVQSNEECDDGNANAGDGCHLCGLDPVYDGGGGQLRECALHWGISGPPLVGPSVTCPYRNAQCDVGSIPNQCTLRVFYCFNRGDFVGGGPPPCTPTNIARVELTGASLSGPGALTSADRDAVLESMRQTLARGGSTVVRTGNRLDATPAVATPRACGLFLLNVPRSAQRVVSLRATDGSGSNDDDAMTLNCQ
jgi:cysteine-rich repeat protein